LNLESADVMTRLSVKAMDLPKLHGNPANEALPRLNFINKKLCLTKTSLGVSM